MIKNLVPIGDQMGLIIDQHLLDLLQINRETLLEVVIEDTTGAGATQSTVDSWKSMASLDVDVGADPGHHSCPAGAIGLPFNAKTEAVVKPLAAKKLDWFERGRSEDRPFLPLEADAARQLGGHMPPFCALSDR